MIPERNGPIRVCLKQLASLEYCLAAVKLGLFARKTQELFDNEVQCTRAYVTVQTLSELIWLHANSHHNAGINRLTGGGDWKRETGKRGTVKNTWPENARLEKAAPNCRTGKRGKRHIWKAKWGPRTEPWGTPQEQVWDEQKLFSHLTRKERSDK